MTTPFLDRPLANRPLQGRVALVTGAATALAGAGATVAISHHAQTAATIAPVGAYVIAFSVMSARTTASRYGPS
ncbi:hypothetical protein [Streptomyces sp. NPDC048142]|uniref:hypothetical protein n=1 Tax=Streptomyces sp. NPDC048142 TaxID=3365501 RepID=UPI0037239098